MDIIQILLTRMDLSERFEAMVRADFHLNKREKIVRA